jgi:succinate dehydrogenase / fumarate reductase cytochrome b subunit
MFSGSRVRRVFSSSVGTKLLIGLTGLALFAYLIVHLAGNLLIFGGQDTFNEYSHRLISNPLVVPIEIGLLLIFLIHVYKTAKMWIDNQSARPVRYQKTVWAGHTSRKSVASTTMIYSGLTIFLLVLIHVKQFKFGTIYEIGNPPVRDLYRTEVEVFSEPGWVVLYLIFVGLVAAHLRHGIASAVQSLGLNHPIYTKRIVLAGTVLAVVIGAGFAIIPLWVLLTR